MENRIIWITGASSGIGRALALQLAAHNTVIASARSAEKLRSLKAQAPQIIVQTADVNKPAELNAVASHIEQLYGHLDLLIANAGCCEYMDVNCFDSSIAERMMYTNYLGFIYTLEAALPLLRRSRIPYIAAMSSSAVYAGLPRAEAYSASKAAISQFMESLAADMRPEGFRLSVIHPGFVDTELTRSNDFPMPMLMNVENAAERIIDGLNKGKYNIEFPKTLTWVLRALSAIPWFLRHRITSSLSRNAQHGL